MNRREFVISGLGAAAALSFPFGIAGQKKAIEPDLGALADGKGINPSNRTLSRLTEGTRKGVRLSGAEGEWPVYLPDIKFANGTIELDMKGKDVQGASFIGVAFHGVDGTTYDAIYFRPFNFKTDDQARVLRAVQYVSHPAHPWQKLRADTPGQVRKACQAGAGSERLVPCAHRRGEPEGERVRRQRDRTLPDRQPAERSEEWTGRRLGGQYLRRRLRQFQDRSRVGR